MSEWVKKTREEWGEKCTQKKKNTMRMRPRGGRGAVAAAAAAATIMRDRWPQNQIVA